MPEVYDYSASPRSFANWALAEALAAYPLDSKVLDPIAPPFVIELSINGVELDFSRAMKLMDEQFENLVRGKAEDIIRERFGEAEAAIVEAQEKAKGALLELFRKLGGTDE